MNDRAIMENLLHTTKGVCDLYMHGTIESSTQNVHNAFNTALDDSLCLQNQLYRKMTEKGWYTVDQAPQSDLDALQTEFASSR